MTYPNPTGDSMADFPFPETRFPLAARLVSLPLTNVVLPLEVTAGPGSNRAHEPSGTLLSGTFAI